jgi:hypothetical protein
MANEKSIVKVNVRKHEVAIEDELIVTIKHKKDCSNPCSELRNIVMYLEDELFVAEGFVIVNNR